MGFFETGIAKTEIGLKIRVARRKLKTTIPQEWLLIKLPLSISKITSNFSTSSLAKTKTRKMILYLTEDSLALG